jgi:hypothetical protein
MKLKKNQLKKRHKKWSNSTRINFSNLWNGSWNQDNFIKNKQKKWLKST